MSLRNSIKTWPFKWSNSIKRIRNQLDVYVDLTPGSDKPIKLRKADYDELLNTLPSNFMRIGTPIYRGREIKRREV